MICKTIQFLASSQGKLRNVFRRLLQAIVPLIHASAASKLRCCLRITFLLLFCLQISTKSFAQSSITLSERNAPLEKVLNNIRKQSGYLFFYNQDWMKKSQPVNLSLKNVTLKQALEATFANQPFTYDIVDKTISLRIKDVSKSANPDGKKNYVTVRSMVLDTLSKPVSGATVKVRGTNQATLTDALGIFELKGVDIEAIIDITNIGYAQKTLKAGLVPLIIKLHEAVSQLDAVEVQAYSKTSQRLTTGSQTTITAAQLAVSPAPNILEAMQGMVPGMTITQRGGNTSSNFVISLRGMNSLASAADPNNVNVPYINSPLILLDGFPLAGSNSSFTGLANGSSAAANLTNSGISILYTLNPADVESVTVLKDAAATSIYGSRGANGVILIMTKRAKGGKLNVTASVNYGLSMPSNKLKLMNTQEYTAMRWEAIRNDKSEGSTDVNNSPDLVLWDQNRNVDWQKLLLGNKPNLNAQFNVSGGTGATTFLASGSYNDSYAGFKGVPDAIVDQYKETRTTFSVASATQTADNRFRIATRMAISNANSFLPSSDLSTLIYLAPNAPDLFINGQPNWAQWTTPNGTNILPSGVASMANPTSTLMNNFNANTDITYDIIKQLTLRVSGSYSNNAMNMYQVSSSSASTAPYLRASYGAIGLLRISNFQNMRYSNWTTEANLSYTKQLGKHRFSMLGGVSFLKNDQNSSGLNISGYTSDLLQRTPAGGTSTNVSIATVDVNKLASVYGQAGYNYDDKYLFNISARRDGSSTFGNNRAWGNFGSVSGGWIFSSEDWLKQLTAKKLFSYGKLRVSYGTVGSPVLTNYQYLANYTALGAVPYEGVATLFPARISNPDMQWSTVTKLGGGLDLGFLNDQLLVTAEYYRGRTSNMILGGATTAIVGGSGVIANFPGVVQNTGFEGTLSYRSAAKRTVTWTSSINIGINRNKLVSFPNIDLLAGYSSTYQVGQPISRVQLPTYGGVDPATGLIIGAKARAPITSFDNLPAFTGGFQEQVNYKGFSLAANFEYAKQKGLQNMVIGNPPGQFNNNQLSGVFDDRWQKPGDVTKIPAFTVYNGALSSTYYSSSAFYGDISFIRLRNARLNYSLPPSVLHQLKLAAVGVFISGSNLLYISKYRGLTPDRMLLTAGLSVTF